MPLGAAVAAFAIGFCVVAQARSNGEMAVVTGDALLAGVLSLSTGSLILAVVVAARASSRAALTRGIAAQLRSGGLRPWHLLGGVGGAAFIGAQVLSVPLLGVALVTVASVAATTAMSLAVDRWGIGPGGVRPVSRRRAIAAVAAVVAVTIAVSGRLRSGDLVWWAVVIVMVAGAMVAVQLALNGMVAQRTGDAFTAAFVNFLLALLLLLLALVVEHVAGHGWTPPPAPWQQPELWLGGPMGVVFISAAAWLVKPLGVLLFGLLSVAGQLTGSLLSDLLLPTPGTVVTWQLVVGVVMTGAAVAWAARPSPPAA